MLKFPKIPLWLILVLVGMALLFVVDWILAIQIQKQQMDTYSINSQQNREDSTIFSGPISLIVDVAWHWIGSHLEAISIAITAIATAIMAIFTVRLWFSTDKLWKETKAGGETAKISADAANKSAEIAEQALIAGQRAFVSVTSFRTVGLIDFKTGKLIHWSFAPNWTNAGDTPTRNMSTHVSLLLFDKEMPEDWDFPDIWPPKTNLEKIASFPLGISPKTSIPGQVIKVPVGDIELVISGKKFLYLWGWASYFDVFPRTKKHVTRFAMQIHIGGDPHSPDQTSFEYLSISRYNCSDEECDRQDYPVDWAGRKLVAE